MIFLIIIIMILLFLYIKEHSKSKKLERDFQYINARLLDIVKQDDDNYILLPSDISAVKETVININSLLEKFQNTKISYNRSQKAVLQIFTNISHDLRTPITVLRGYIEMLYIQSQKEEVSPALKVMIDKMQKNSEELVHSVNNFFNMAKIHSGDIILNIQKTNLTQLCHETVLEFYELMEKQDFQVEVHIKDKPVYANVDKDALQRILKNLIDNSIKYGASGKYLGISLYEKQDHIYIDIEDHGAGITDSEINHIFTRTYTADRKKGNGLGLAISQELAKLMGGSVSVCSTPHVKTVFTVDLHC